MLIHRIFSSFNNSGNHETMKLSIAAHITTGFLLTQVILFTISMCAGSSYILWAFGGASSAILMLIGAIAGPICILIGLFTKTPTVWRCGLALVIFNTVPFAGIMAIAFALGL